MPGISPRTLSERLRALEQEGILERRRAESPPRVEYELTDKGKALLPIIDEMRRFGHDWLVPEHEHSHEPAPRDRRQTGGRSRKARSVSRAAATPSGT